MNMARLILSASHVRAGSVIFKVAPQGSGTRRQRVERRIKEVKRSRRHTHKNKGTRIGFNIFHFRNTRSVTYLSAAVLIVFIYKNEIIVSSGPRLL